MFFKKDNLKFGLILGLLAPILGFMLFKMYRFSVFTIKETLQFMYLEPGHKTLTAALSFSLLANAAFFTFYINAGKDQTAKGIFLTTLVYGIVIIFIKYFT